MTRVGECLHGHCAGGHIFDNNRIHANGHTTRNSQCHPFNPGIAVNGDGIANMTAVMPELLGITR
ncbi:MAG: hypothetical protein PHO08_06770 [Methylococcales bacterium]|nr:hypothetical protein [Methylococcales bacterium]